MNAVARTLAARSRVLSSQPEMLSVAAIRSPTVDRGTPTAERVKSSRSYARLAPEMERSWHRRLNAVEQRDIAHRLWNRLSLTRHARSGGLYVRA